jgi:hypothetical protein
MVAKSYIVQLRSSVCPLDYSKMHSSISVFRPRKLCTSNLVKDKKTLLLTIPEKKAAENEQCANVCEGIRYSAVD